MINLLYNTLNQPFKFVTKKWVENNDDAREKYNTNSQIKFKNAMFKSNLFDHSDAYILEKGIKRVADTSATAAAPNNENEKVIFKIAPNLLIA